ncbi:MAG: leucine-rich repeat protein [Clostridia bacterium]|nr:leucine-rich repeat protein [Clostridia bacterium]
MKSMTKLLSLLLCLAMIGGCFVGCDFESTDSSNEQASQPQDGEDQSSTTETGEWTVTFDANGGAFENGETTTTQTVAQGTRLTVPQTPRRTGYTFSGWSINQNTSEPWDFANATVNRAITLYASWTARTASVLSVEGATINEREIFLIVDQNNQSVSLSDKVVCTEGCVWKLYRDQMGQIEIPTKIAAGMDGALESGENIFYIVVTSIDGTMTSVYKLTVFRHYTVSINYYHKNELIHSEQTTTGNEFFLTYTPNLDGYTFYGWKNESGAPCISVIPWGDVDLYSNTEAQQFTVTYDANEGSVNLTGTAVLFGENFTFEIPTRTGYRFVGWYYGETKLTDEDGKSLCDWQILDNVTITAAWEINSYSLSLQRNDKCAGIVCDMEKQTYDYGESITVRATTNQGYRFLGWFKDSTPMSTELSYTFAMPAEQLLLTAKWEILPEMRPFEFVSTPTLCEITHLKDRTLEEIVIPDYVTSIEDQAFENCSNVTSVTLGIGLTSIGQYSFGNCIGLTSIAIPNNVKNVGFNAFYCCSSLAEISIPDSVLGIQSDAFYGTAYLNDETNWVGGVLYIGNHLIRVNYTTLSNATTINIKSGTKTIANSAFQNLRKLTSITIPDGVTSIGSGAFSGCTSLTAITIPDSVTSIGNGILSNTGYRFDTVTYIGNHLIQASESLSGAYTIKSGTKTIADNAFSYCERLTGITIPASVTSIGNAAFLNCNSLTTITLPESVTSIGNQAFSD